MNIEIALAWRNLWRRSKRTWITVAAMVFCNAILVFGVATQAGSYNAMIDATLKLFSGHIQISALGYQDNPEMRKAIPNGVELAARIRAAYPNLNVVARSQSFVLAATEERSAGVSIIGVQPEFEREFSSIGKMLNATSLNQSSDVVLGEALSRHLNINDTTTLSFIGSNFTGGFAANFLSPVQNISTGMSDLDRTLALIAIDDFNVDFEMNDQVHQILILAPTLDDVDITKASIETWLNDESLEVLSWQQLNPGLQESIYADMASAAIMYSVLIALVIFSVLNTQLMSVLERTREFGVFKAVGLSGWRLTKLIFLETFLLAAMGFVIGMLVGAGITLFFENVGIAISGMDQIDTNIMLPNRLYPMLTPITVFLGPSIVFMGCILTAWYPALKITRLEPVEAMRVAA